MNDAKQDFELQSKQFGALLIIDHFLNVTIIQTFWLRLIEIQQLVLKLLDIPVEVFRKFDF